MPSDKLAFYYTRNYNLEGLPVPRSLEEFLSSEYKDMWFTKERGLNLIRSVKTTGRILDAAALQAPCFGSQSRKDLR